jgi:hypothetical protein
VFLSSARSCKTRSLAQHRAALESSASAAPAIPGLDRRNRVPCELPLPDMRASIDVQNLSRYLTGLRKIEHRVDDVRDWSLIKQIAEVLLALGQAALRGVGPLSYPQARPPLSHRPA